MRRRRFLATLPAVALAGCNAPTGSLNSEYVHFLTLFNYTGAEHRVRLTVRDESGETIRAFDYDAEPEFVREHVPIRAPPATATLRIDDRDPRELDWPTVESCRAANSAGKPGLEIQLLDPDRRSGTESPRVRTEWSCQSIEPDENQTVS